MLYVTHEMLGMEEGGGGAWREKATKGNKGGEGRKGVSGHHKRGR